MYSIGEKRQQVYFTLIHHSAARTRKRQNSEWWSKRMEKHLVPYVLCIVHVFVWYVFACDTDNNASGVIVVFGTRFRANAISILLQFV